MKLVILEEAENEAEEASLWYEERSSGLGYDFLAELRERLGLIAEHPFRQPPYPTSLVEVDIRRLQLRRFPYMVVYLILSERIVVLATAHLKRKPGYWLSRLPPRATE